MMESLTGSLRSSRSFPRFSPVLQAKGAAISGQTSSSSLSCRNRSPVRRVLQSPSLVAYEVEFVEASKKGNWVPLHRCIFVDNVTPVLAYRCLVKEDDREAPSFLFESVEPGFRSSQVGRYSVVGSEPSIEIIAKENKVTIVDHEKASLTEKVVDDPMEIPKSVSDGWEPQLLDGLPDTFCGGWVGYFSYDTVCYVEKKKLLFRDEPQDERNLADIHLGLYEDVIVFDHVQKEKGKGVVPGRFAAHAYVLDSGTCESPLDHDESSHKTQPDAALINVVGKEFVKMLHNKRTNESSTSGAIKYAGNMSYNSSVGIACFAMSMNDHSWIIDSGASDHMTANATLFSKCYTLHKPVLISLPDGSIKQVRMAGTISLSPKIVLDHVLYVPDFSHNLLSVSKFLESTGFDAHFTAHGCTFEDHITKCAIVKGIKEAGLYKLDTRQLQGVKNVSCCGDAIIN